MPAFVSLNAAPAYVQFTFSKHGEEKKSGFVPLIGNQQLFSESGYGDKFIGGGSPGSIVRNLHYVANVEVKGWEENVGSFQLEHFALGQRSVSKRLCTWRKWKRWEMRTIL